MNTKVSYGALAPAMIGGLGVVVNALLAKAKRDEAPVSLKRLPDVIEFSDSGIWGDDSIDPEVEPRVFRVSDFNGDFRLDYSSAPPRSITPDKLAKFQLRRGDILVVKSSGSANQVVSGRIAVFDPDSQQAYAASNFTMRLRPKADIEPYYLAFVLGSPPIREAVADSVKTMTYPNLSFRIYSAIEVPVIPLSDQKLVSAFFNAFLNKKELPSLPSYLAVQRRMVARVEELAAKIDEARTLRHQAAEEAESLMAGEERRVWPEGALVGARTLESVCTFLARGKQSGQGDSDHFLIKTQHVQQSRYIPTLMRLAHHVAAKVKPDAVVQDGDTLIACSAAGCLGRVARFRDEGKTASTDTHVAVARPNTEIVCSDYLYAYLRGAQGQHQLRSRERGDWQREKISFRLTELNLNDLRKVPIPVPPLPEQRRIVAKLDALKRLQAETAAELDALLPSILDKAFKGEL
jgi:type I restriction enzyme, S subunit